jgi:cyclase
MLKHRVIPVLLLKNGMLVRSERFSFHQIIGNPIYEVQRFNEWNVDELIYIDISKEDSYDLGRDDAKVKYLRHPLAILEEVSKTCFMPLTWGGRLRTIADMQARFQCGADKITINTAALKTPDLITEAARNFGSQAVVVCIDVLEEDGTRHVMGNGGKQKAGKDPVSWAKEVEARGAGEILLQSTNRDGLASGYDLELIGVVSSATRIPVIALGGAGMYKDFAKAIQAGAAAAAAANIWHFKELVDRNAKREMHKAGIEIRM